MLTAIGNLNDFDPASDVVAHVNLVDTTTTNTDMVAAAPSAASVADAVWDEALSGHAEAGSAGAALAAADAPTASENATAVWSAETRELTSAGAGGATAQEVWEYTTRELTDKAGFSLAVAYDAAKTAASQTSVNDIPTNSELATALAGADDAVLAAIGNLPTDADVQTAAAAALTAYDPPTKAELDSAVSPLATAAGVTALGTPLQAANYTAPDNAGIAAAEAAAGAAQTAAEAIVIPTDYAKATDVAALNDVSTAEVQASAAAALTAYDPPTRTEATSDKGEVIAAMSDITVDVGDVTATVDLTPVTEALAPIEADLAALGAGEVTVISPVAECG